MLLLGVARLDLYSRAFMRSAVKQATLYLATAETHHLVALLDAVATLRSSRCSRHLENVIVFIRTYSSASVLVFMPSNGTLPSGI